MWDENNIDIPNVKKPKISKFDDNHDHQYFEEIKKYVMKHFCFNYIWTVDLIVW